MKRSVNQSVLQYSTLHHLMCSIGFMLFILISPIQGQSLFEENIAPSPNVPEDAWDGKQIPNTPNFAMLSNTMAYGRNLLAITILNQTGGVLQRTVVWDVPNTTAMVSGYALDFDLNTAGNATGIFITGTRSLNGTDQMIVLRTDMAGFPTWTQTLPVFNAAGLIQYRDNGVSIERQPNGDVIAIGSSIDLNTGLSQMIAARFTAAGALIWSNRYRSGNVPGNIIPAESCNGMVGNPAVDVVAVTGAFINSANISRTFGSCINATTGVELWRTYYNSGLASDAGFDIVQKPGNGPFMIVGGATPAGSISSNLWVLNVKETTGALPAGASAYYADVAGGSLIGRDVCVNTANNRAIIAGYYDRPVGGAIINNAFLSQIGFANCANPNFIRVYTASSPNPAGTESVNPVVVAGTNVAGYILTTDGFPQSWGGGTNAAHPIYVNTVGMHGYTGDCPILNASVVKTCVGTRTNLQKVRSAFPWMPVTLNWEILTNAIAACDGVAPPPLTGTAEERIENIEDAELADGISVSPNPVSAGEDLQLVLEGFTDNIEIRMTDLTGRSWLVKTIDILSSDERSVCLLSTDALPPGTYILHIQADKKMTSAKILIR